MSRGKRLVVPIVKPNSSTQDQHVYSGIEFKFAFMVCLLTTFAACLATAKLGEPLLGFLIVANCLLVAAALPFLGPVNEPGKPVVMTLFLAVAYLHGSLVPLADMVFGPPSLGFRFAATDAAAVHSLSVSLVFTASVLGGWGLNRRRPIGFREEVETPQLLPWLMLAVGFLGLLIRLNIGTQSLFNSGQAVDSATLGILPALGTFATPLLPVGAFLLLWRKRSKFISFVMALVLVPMCGVALASFSLNRAAILWPVTAMFITLLRYRRSRRLRRSVPIFAVCGLLAFFYVGQIRTQLNWAAQGYASVEQKSNVENALESFNVYLQSPYLTGIVYEGGEQSNYSVQSLAASALAPVPIVGKSYRAESGNVIYNDTIYGGHSNDQILPLWQEIERSIGLWGVILFGAIIGIHMKRLHVRMQAATSKLRFYTLALWCLWVAQVSTVSISILSQILIFFIAPLVLWSSLTESPSRVHRSGALGQQVAEHGSK